MAKSKKKIETFKVVFKSDHNVTFFDLFSKPEMLNSHKVRGKDISIRIMDNNAEFIVGLVETSRNDNIPPKKNRKSKKIDKIGLTGEEGLAYANVFLLEKKRNILLYEVNKFGCFVDHFLIFIYRCFKDHKTIKSFDIKLTAILKANEYQRMINMHFHKSLELDVAYPEQIMKDYKHQNDALFNICKIGAQTNSTKISTKLSVKATKEATGLTSSTLQTIIDRVLNVVRGPNGGNIKKVVVEGYETDSEDGKLSSIDLIADRYLKEISLDEPRENIDLLEHQRSLKIKDLYANCLHDFDAIFGKK